MQFEDQQHSLFLHGKFLGLGASFIVIKLEPSITFELIGIESCVIAPSYISLTRGIHF